MKRALQGRFQVLGSAQAQASPFLNEVLAVLRTLHVLHVPMCDTRGSQGLPGQYAQYTDEHTDELDIQETFSTHL